MNIPLTGVTGIGAMPYSQESSLIRDTASAIRDLCSIAYLPEFPQRGPGADAVGRTMGLVSQVSEDFSLTTVASGWRLEKSRGRDMTRADSFLAQDTDVVEEIFEGFTGLFKLKCVGPWSLAAAIEKANGEKLLEDRGLVRDLRTALREAINNHVAAIQRRIPGAQFIVQLDEHDLVRVNQGAVPTQSGYRKYSSVATPELIDGLELFTDLPLVIHTCSGINMWEVFTKLKPIGISFPLMSIHESDYDALGELKDSGVSFIFGVSGADVDTSRDKIAEHIVSIGQRIGFAEEEWLASVALSPVCGLVGMSASQARHNLESLGKVL